LIRHVPKFMKFERHKNFSCQIKNFT